MEIWENHPIIVWTELLLDSYEELVGRSLLPRIGTAKEQSKMLFFAPFVLVSHGTEANPIFNYGNRTALDLWGLTWDELRQTPSRATVQGEEIKIEERQKMLDLVKKQGYIDNYQGVRTTKNGQLFRIEKAIVWNVIDRDGIDQGQAATFADWIFL
jgi:MEKHLA domain